MSPRRPDMPSLRRADLLEDPIAQFGVWFERALAEAPLPEAMTLATVDPEGRPDARMVLLRGFGPEGFRFFTNYRSAKAAQLETVPEAALVIYWRELDRQVRIRGRVERLADAESDAYFASRPRPSQLGAWASPQSAPLESRQELDRQLEEITRRFEGGEVPRPEDWGGYLLRPREVELWQGQLARLHDRFRYVRRGEGWTIERLGP